MESHRSGSPAGPNVGKQHWILEKEEIKKRNKSEENDDNTDINLSKMNRTRKWRGSTKEPPRHSSRRIFGTQKGGRRWKKGRW
jgi:hypothetical protein